MSATERDMRNLVEADGDLFCKIDHPGMADLKRRGLAECRPTEAEHITAKGWRYWKATEKGLAAWEARKQR